jgi:hypothetical protein
MRGSFTWDIAQSHCSGLAVLAVSQSVISALSGSILTAGDKGHMVLLKINYDDNN